ncbi:nucleotidyltransferase [Candidatus Shapirobacteria bacterium]|nr:MAG: nucleotidyltransferase [Candidatus Shapirobacteria bacterium]
MELREKVEKIRDSLFRAVNRLTDALKQEKSEFIRDSVVQRFEFSFELCWKLMKLVLAYLGSENCNSPRECITVSAGVGLIDNPEKWLDYLELRNLSVHMYSQKMAEDVYELASDFVEDVKKLEKVVEEKLGRVLYNLEYG